MTPSLIARTPNTCADASPPAVPATPAAIKERAKAVHNNVFPILTASSITPPPQAREVRVQRSSFFATACAVMGSVGTGIVQCSKKGLRTVITEGSSIGKETVNGIASVLASSAECAYQEISGVKEVAHLTAQATLNIGSSCYHNLRAVKSLGQRLASYALSKVLPKKGALDEQIKERRTYLQTHTESSICKETCSLLSNFVAGYLQHQLIHGEKIEEPLRSSLVTRLLRNASQERAEYGFFGDALKMGIQERPEIISEVIEANLLKMFCNIVKRLKEVQDVNNNWLVDLTQNILASYTEDLKKLKANIQTKERSNEEQTLFLEHLAKAILKIALPNGEKDLDLPIVGKNQVAHFLMTELEAFILPKILKNLLIDITSEATRDKLVLKIFTMFKEFISTGTFSSNTESAPVNRKASKPYATPDIFKQHLAYFIETFLDFLDPSLSQLATIFQTKSLIKKHGGVLISALGEVNLLATVNRLLKLLLPLLNNGSWQGSGVEQKFATVPFTFSTTMKEEEEEIALKLRQHEQVLRETELILNTLTHDFSGISSLGVDSFIPRPTREHIEQVLQSDWFLDHWRLSIWLLLIHAAHEILKFIYWIFGKAKIEETSYALYERTKTMYFKQTIRPLESIIATIIHSA